MKQTLSFLAVLLFTVFTISSCSKKDNPADNNVFVGTYTGKTSYTKTGSLVGLADGKVTVTKVGDKYRFDFRDNANGSIPAITDIEIPKGQSSYTGTINGYTGNFSISASNLDLNLTKEGAIWTADCSR